MGDVGEEREVHSSGALVWLSRRRVPSVERAFFCDGRAGGHLGGGCLVFGGEYLTTMPLALDEGRSFGAVGRAILFALLCCLVVRFLYGGAKRPEPDGDGCCGR